MNYSTFLCAQKCYIYICIHIFINIYITYILKKKKSFVTSVYSCLSWAAPRRCQAGEFAQGTRRGKRVRDESGGNRNRSRRRHSEKGRSVLLEKQPSQSRVEPPEGGSAEGTGGTRSVFPPPRLKQQPTIWCVPISLPSALNLPLLPEKKPLFLVQRIN